MSKEKKKPKVPFTHQLQIAQEDLLQHRDEVSTRAHQVKIRFRERMSSKGMLGFAAGTGFLLGEMTRPAPVVVEAPATDEVMSKRQLKRKRVKVEKAQKAEKKEKNSKSGLQTLDELIKTTMHLMAWVRTFEALVNRPSAPENQEKAPDQAQESAGSVSMH